MLIQLYGHFEGGSLCCRQLTCIMLRSCSDVTSFAQSLSKTEALRCRPSTPTAFPLLHESQCHLLKERNLTLDVPVKEYFITAHMKPATSVVSNN